VPKLSVSVAVMNQKEITQTFFESLYAFTIDFELIITDNGSGDETAQFLSEFVQAHENAVLIRHKLNVGFGKAHNIASRRAQGQFFAVLNNDIEFFEFWAEKLYPLFDESNVALVGPSNGVCNSLTPDAQGVFNPEKVNDPDYCEGSCLMMRTKLARKFGPFDEAYRLGYYEDSDLGIRIRKAGFKLKTVPLDWVHYRAKTSSAVAETLDIPGIHFVNEQIFRRRWTSYLLRKRFGKTYIIQRKGSHGDVLLTTPIIEAIKKREPESVICFSTQCPETIARNSQIDYLIPPDLPFQCDEFINLDSSYERRFNEHIIDVYARVAKVKVLRKRAKVTLLKDDFKFIERYLPPKFNSYIVVDVSDTWQGKQWTIENWAGVTEELRKHNITVVSVGISKTRNLKGIAQIDLINKLSISQTSAVICRAAGFIGAEGLTAHVSQAVDTPCLVLYGCTSPQYVSCSDAMIEHVISSVACQGCRHVSYPSGVTVICKRDYECMKRITVQHVIDQFAVLMQKYGKLEKVVHLKDVPNA
jgi:GT2 family glycosyltransferase